MLSIRRRLGVATNLRIRRLSRKIRTLKWHLVYIARMIISKLTLNVAREDFPFNLLFDLCVVTYAIDMNRSFVLRRSCRSEIFHNLRAEI